MGQGHVQGLQVGKSQRGLEGLKHAGGESGGL